MRFGVCFFLLALLVPPCLVAQSTIAVDTPSEGGLTESLRGDGWLRWLSEREQGPKIEIGPGARGETRILVRQLPVSDEVGRWLEGLPVRIGDSSLELSGRRYTDPRLSLAVRLPKGESTTWLVVGSETERVEDLARLILLKEAGIRIWGREDESFDYLLRETAWLERSGVWRQDEQGIRVDSEAERDDFRDRDRYYSSMKTVVPKAGSGRFVELRAPTELEGRPEVRRLAERLNRAAEQMAKRIPVTLERPIEVVVERDHPTQGRYLGEIGEAVVAADGKVHLIWHPEDEYAYLHGIAAALIQRAGLGEGLGPWIREGAALWLSRRWLGHDYADWLPRLATAQLLPGAEELLAKEKQADGSRLLWLPVAASLVESLPGANLRQKLATAPTESQASAHFEDLSKLGQRGEELGSMHPDRRADLPFLDGVSFAMLNRLDGGYHAPAVDESLARLKALGTNAVSVMPFAYQASPNAPELRFLNDNPVSETDVGTLYSTRRAHAAGLRVLWKPHIWISNESWPGDVEMPDEAAWAAWWAGYRRYIVHHAILAEWSGSELFSIGVELGRTVKREEEWRQLIAAVRLFYSGAVTYAGNWFGDYDQAPFWDALDYVGIDAYFPLASAAEVEPKVLSDGAAEVVKTLRQASERFGKPVLLTEVGFSARVGAWVDPHQEGGQYSEEDQALAYQALLDALGKPPWLAGVFAWKAFSAERGSSERPDFRFLGRRAEAVVGEYFSSEPRAESPSER